MVVVTFRSFVLRDEILCMSQIYLHQAVRALQAEKFWENIIPNKELVKPSREHVAYDGRPVSIFSDQRLSFSAIDLSPISPVLNRLINVQAAQERC